MKLFTLEQANRTLPLVRRIVEDIVRTYGRWQERVREFEVVAGRLRADGIDEHAETLQNEAQALAAEITNFVSELEALGVQFKGFDLGLVDFPSEMNGRVVHLCWRLGEPTIQHWHEVGAGFAGRQPLTPVGVA
jgi:hypothetical protein